MPSPFDQLDSGIGTIDKPIPFKAKQKKQGRTRSIYEDDEDEGGEAIRKSDHDDSVAKMQAGTDAAFETAKKSAKRATQQPQQAYVPMGQNSIASRTGKAPVAFGAKTGGAVGRPMHGAERMNERYQRIVGRSFLRQQSK